jgi:hypothetical protein
MVVIPPMDLLHIQSADWSARDAPFYLARIRCPPQIIRRSLRSLQRFTPLHQPLAAKISELIRLRCLPYEARCIAIGLETLTDEISQICVNAQISPAAIRS